MSYELFQQGPAAYIPVILLSLVITLATYGAFPLIFARTRKKVITKKKYNWLCCGVNFLVMILFYTVINGKPGNIAPYLLWTWVFSASGRKTLKSRGILEESQPSDCAKTSAYQTGQVMGSDIALEPNLKTETPPVPEEKPPIRFCRKCGFELIAGSEFCSKCGTLVIKE